MLGQVLLIVTLPVPAKTLRLQSLVYHARHVKCTSRQAEACISILDGPASDISTTSFTQGNEAVMTAVLLVRCLVLEAAW